jgi:phospholipase/lecithinase/hemolysin
MERLAFAAIAVIFSHSALAYDGVYAFGDSLSDNGNVYAMTGGAIPPFPYYNGRFSNGPVMVEYLAQRLGVGLHDYAYGGATTGTTNLFSPSLPGLSQEIAQFGTGSLDPNGLYTVWAGANDFSTSTSISTSTSNIVNAVDTLEQNGARHILVINMPDLGLTPRLLAENAVYPNASTYATAYSLRETPNRSTIF